MIPLVSVLIPLYNNRLYIDEAIRSVLAQTYRNFEIIVVDDGSEDGGDKTAAGYPEVRLFRKEHSGISRTRNFALSRAQGDLITFLDADDLWDPEKLSLQVKYMMEHPECSIVFCRFRNFTDIPGELRTDRQEELLRTEFSTYLPGACIRKELFDRSGVFSESCAFGEDTEWEDRLRLARIDLSHCIEKDLYFRRVHEQNITLTHPDMDESARYAIMAQAIRKKWRNKKNADQ